ncbi:MAG: DUF3566 domain-containing protein [Candidatus Latescibacter sp.]|nr:DUF3566 domain-containing protein [Candidatus Latescibacter sp.]
MVKKWKVRRIGLWSAMKIGGSISCVFGFAAGVFLGLVFAFFSSLIAMMLSEHNPAYGFGGLIIFPVICTLFFGFMGIILSLVFALFYNLSAALFGGIELEMEAERVNYHPEEYSSKLHEAI